MINKVTLLGNLGADPEVAHLENGTAYCRLSIATNKKLKDGSTATVWHNVTAWGVQAENCAKYLSKGRLVYVEGEIKTGKYTDKNGVEKPVFGITAHQVQFIPGGSNESNNRKTETNADSSPTLEIPFA